MFQYMDIESNLLIRKQLQIKKLKQSNLKLHFFFNATKNVRKKID